MNVYKKIFLVWMILEVCTLFSIISLPHLELSPLIEIFRAFDLFFAILCYQLSARETDKGNKLIFFNLCLYLLALAIGGYLYLLVGKAIFSEQPYSKHYFYQYSTAIYDFLLALTVTYTIFNVILHKYKVYLRYFFTLLMVGIVFCFFYHPIFLDAKYVYKTEEAIDFRAIRDVFIRWRQENKTDPSNEILGFLVNLRGLPKQTGSEQAYHEKKLKRISELSIYLKGKNYIIVLVKPLVMNTIIMNSFCLLLLFLYCSYRFFFDPPQGAYLDKIILLFIPYCSVEILHAYWFISSIDFFEFVQTFDLGVLISRCLLSPIFVLVVLRLNFINSPIGFYYEQKLQENPSRVSRWRDVFDRMVTRHFFERNNLNRRIFVVMNRKDRR